MSLLGNIANIATLGGYGSAQSAKKGLNAQQNYLNQNTDLYNTSRNQDMSAISSATDPYTRNASGDWDAYRQASSQDLSQYNYDPYENFTAETDVSKYLDPSISYQQKAATQSVEGSAANRGKLFSGATGKAVADRSQDIAQTGYNTAYNQMMQSNQQNQNLWSQKTALDRQAKDQGLNLANTRTQNLGNIANAGMQANQYALQNKLNTNQNYTTNMANNNTAMGNVAAQQAQIPNFMQSLVNSVPSWMQLYGKATGG